MFCMIYVIPKINYLNLIQEVAVVLPYPLPVPLVHPSVCLPCVWLLFLMLECRLCGAEVPRRLHDVLWDVRVDVSVTDNNNKMTSVAPKSLEPSSQAYQYESVYNYCMFPEYVLLRPTYTQNRSICVTYKIPSHTPMLRIM